MAMYDEATTIEHARYLKPARSLREQFSYNNLGWVIAGNVLSAVANESWCTYITKNVLQPLQMDRTFCSVQDIPNKFLPDLAQVHYLDPCEKNVSGGPVSAWKFSRSMQKTARCAAGSMVSCTKDFSQMMKLLLRKVPNPAVPEVVRQETLHLIQAGHEIAPDSWLQQGGLDWKPQAAEAVMVGYGFDYVGNLFHGEQYIDKSGDTGLHKTRFGALPKSGLAVLVFGNLGGSVGGPLTALKFGLLAMLSGHDGDAQVNRSLALTNYEEQLSQQLTCNECGRSQGREVVCSPSNLSTLPLKKKAYVGEYSDGFGGLLRVFEHSEASKRHFADTSVGLYLSLGPVDSLPLQFGTKAHFANSSCAEFAKAISNSLPFWSTALSGLEHLPGWCTLTQFTLPEEILAAGVSKAARTTAFPWGAYFFPDPLQVFFLSHKDQVLRVIFGTYLDAAFVRQGKDGILKMAF
ncbi:hypothetical protein CYMTET_8230 [Cymbomonas tetramitiformis]|uniref:Beta-lactamase-related domain-containing protein n=1 Tax=Cymbomonas tetramitiformis TaxID=36881 RepID=A0AAE0LGN8_9CHLO|nr:hypothetical protein CYMTET_8230 [Cymbomonas tetramitiformis]|eukprot:gene11552-13649_t